jgi:hypothetical protein
MKAIQTQLQINRVSISKDDSVSFSATTPALNDAELTAFRNMAKLLVNALFEPQEGSSGVLKITEALGGKSPSARLKAVLFVFWKQEGEPQNDFETFYRIKMESIIDAVKAKLE